MKIGELFVDVIPQLSTADVSTAMNNAAKSATSDVSFGVDSVSLSKEVSKAADKAAKGAATDIKFSADTSAAQTEVRNLADAADDVGGSSAAAAGGIGDLAGAVELAGFPGLASAMELSAVGIQGVAGASDLAKLAAEKLSIESLKNTALAGKDIVVKGLQTAATVTLAGATAALGAAFKFALGPVGLIIAAIALLVGALIWAYKNNEDFRDKVNAVFAAVKGFISGVVSWFTDVAMPALQHAWEVVSEAISSVWNNVLKPVWDTFAKVVNWLWNTVLSVVFEAIKIYFTIMVTVIKWYWDNVLSPTFNAIATVVSWVWNNVLKPTFKLIADAWKVLSDGIKWAWDNVIKPAWDALSTAIDSVKGFFDKAKTGAQEFIDKIKDVKLPGWIQTIVDLIEKIGKGIGGAGASFAKWITGGDAPKSVQGTHIGGGGSTLNKIQSMLPSNLRVTSTYRTPAMNAAVGGVSNSYHLDKNNPAVDIAGPVGAMDAFAAKLSMMGPWRQLLYRVAGHFDHIHVAHQGGMVNSTWGTVPGLRADERPVIAQTGERILSRNEVKHFGNGGVTVQMNGTVIREQTDVSRVAQELDFRLRQRRV